MSEFKFACPVCGQHIKCDSSQSDTPMECPTCFQKIVAPHISATDDTKLILTGIKFGERQASTTFAQSANEILVRKRAWWRAAFGKFPTATIIVLIALLGTSAAVLVNFAGKIFRHEPTANSRTNAPVRAPGSTPSDISSSDNATWTLNLGVVKIPDSAAAGYVHGKILIPQRVVLDAGTLTLRTANPGLPDAGISIYLRATRGEDLAGQFINITTNSSNVPWVDLRWKDDQGNPKRETIKGGYAMQIKFGLPINDRLPGKIYLCTPDKLKSYLAGEFNAKVRRPKSAP